MVNTEYTLSGMKEWGREGGREGGRERGREGGREGRRERNVHIYMYVAEKIRRFNFRHSRVMTKHFNAENLYGTCVCNLG